MDFVDKLLLAILLSAAIVWIASFITHMVLPHHKSEWKGVPDEARIATAVEGVAPGQYMFPYAGSMEAMKSSEFTERLKRGPNGLLLVWPPGPMSMGRNLLLTLLFYIVVGVFVAYVGWHSMGPKGTYLHVFRVIGAAAFMAHGLGWMPFFIWYGWKGFWANLFDSLVYALLTAGTFAWLWPGRT